jgi:predicted DCC family thiol-disulfide oxidoreductase YuxK
LSHEIKDSLETGPLKPILLFNDECGVCRRIASWVRKSDQGESGAASLSIRPIGDDPAAILLLNPDLNIWSAYATIHLLMPDGTMKRGGEAVSEVLRRLPNTKWFAGVFGLKLLGFQPAQLMLDLAYDLLSAVRPLFGCESCGALSPWMKPLAWVIRQAKTVFTTARHPGPTPHFTSHAVGGQRASVM